MGDEWNSRPDGTKGHDLQYWGPPLQFTTDGSILPLAKTANWTMKVALGKPGIEHMARYMWPQKVDPHPLRTDACLGTPLNERGEPAGTK
jgi:hypothetical protein